MPRAISIQLYAADFDDGVLLMLFDDWLLFRRQRDMMKAFSLLRHAGHALAAAALLYL